MNGDLLNGLVNLSGGGESLDCGKHHLGRARLLTFILRLRLDELGVVGAHFCVSIAVVKVPS